MGTASTLGSRVRIDAYPPRTRRRVVIAAVTSCVALSGCDSRQRAASDSSGAMRERAGLSRSEALDSARAFISRSAAAPHVHLDSAEVVAVDSLWRVAFRRRELVVPNVVTVDVHARTGAMRFPGDE